MLPTLACTLKRFSKTQEVVGLVIETQECARESAHAAVEADTVLALFFDFKQQLHRCVLVVADWRRVFLDFQQARSIEAD